MFVRRLAEDLRELGHDPWLDEWEIRVGDCIVRKVEEAIAQADYVVLVLSPAAVESGWVEREWKTVFWEEMQTNRVVILPVLVQPCRVPQLLRTKKYANFTDTYQIGLDQLTQALDPQGRWGEASKNLRSSTATPSKPPLRQWNSEDPMLAEAVLLVEELKLASQPTYVLSAMPSEPCDMTPMFESSSHPIVELLSEPPVLRSHGFDLTTDSTPKIVAGERRRAMNSEYKGLALSVDGILTFVARGDEWFLAPSAFGTIDESQPIRIDPLPLIESSYLFCDLGNRVYELAGAPPTTVTYQIRYARLERQGQPPLLMHSSSHRAKEAPAGDMKREVNVLFSVPFEAVAFRLVASVYTWFGLEHDQIPFISRDDSEARIDRRALASK